MEERISFGDTASAEPTNFDRCIICQKITDGNLQKVTSTESLSYAIRQRQDSIARRLEPILTLNSLENENIYWHGSCRRWYTLKKSCNLAAKRRKNTSSADDQIDHAITSDPPSALTRSQRGVFDYKSQCIVCEKPFTIRKKASLVMTSNRGESLKRKAKEINDSHMLDKLNAHLGEDMDLVAMDVQYHAPCVNAYMTKRQKAESVDIASKHKNNAFVSLTEQLYTQLIANKSVLCLSSIRDTYRTMLQEKGFEGAEGYRTSLLKKRLLDHFGDAISFWPQQYGRESREYVCSSVVSVGDALREIDNLKTQHTVCDQESKIIQEAAKILYKNAKAYKMEQSECNESSFNISKEQALDTIPCNIFNFAAQLITGKDLSVGEDRKVSCSEDIEQKSLYMSQYILYAICKVPTPLSLGIAFHIYNETRSKSLITLLNHLNVSVSYDTFHRYLTGVCEQMMDAEKEDGIFCPPAVKGCKFIHFAIDNADWHEKTPDGSTFHAMTTNVYGYEHNTILDDEEHPVATSSLLTDDVSTRNHENSQQTSVNSSLPGGHFGDIPKLKTGRTSRRTVSSSHSQQIDPHYISLTERRKARSLENMDLADLPSAQNPYLHHMNMAWQICRNIPTKLLELEIDVCPSWSTFFTQLSPVVPATQIGYGPMIPSSPNDPSVVHKGLEYAAKLAAKFGMKHTVVTADQAIYEIVFGLREQAPSQDDTYEHLILFLGLFHLSGNYMGAVGKIMRSSGAELILAESGVCKLGTANKIFGHVTDYYQSMRAHKLLCEAMAQLHWESFEEWYQTTNKDLDILKNLLSDLEGLCDFLGRDQPTDADKPRLPWESLQKILDFIKQYDHESTFPTQVFWRNYVKMIHILLRFTAAQRSGDWEQTLTEAGNMLPIIVAAGHHNYSYSLPLFQKEMNSLWSTAPEVYQHFMKGHFVVRRKTGSFNAVPTDMALEQTYNRDAKESHSGLTGITLDAKARTKWLYTKPVSSEASTQFKQMMKIAPINKSSRHHEEGKPDAVTEIIRSITQNMINPFQVKSAELFNIATGQTATAVIRHDLTHVEQIGNDAVDKCLKDKSRKVCKVKLHTFHDMQSKQKQPSQKKKEQLLNEVTILKRIIQLKAAGKEVNLEETIGEFECAKAPPALFESDGLMRHGNKSVWLAAIQKETSLELKDCLPESEKCAAVVVDAMCFIQQHPFLEHETFNDYQTRLRRKLTHTLPVNCHSIHFPGDRYDHAKSRKEVERQRRGCNKPEKEYQVNGTNKTPPFKEFMTSKTNKARLLDFICCSWEATENQKHVTTDLYLSGGFLDGKKSIRVTGDGIVHVPNLESTQEECDTRVLLHAIFSVQHLGAERVVVYGNDTDIIVMLTYYASSLLKDVELWVKKSADHWVPVHELAKHLGPDDCRLQPFLHAFSGKDDTNFIYGIGKTKILKCRHHLDCDVISSYGETDDFRISDDLIGTARNLLMALYGGQTFSSLAALRTHLFIAGGNSKDLRCLPPTEDSFRQHLLRCLYATLVQKRAHVPHPVLPVVTTFGWTMETFLQPVPMLLPPFPELTQSLTSCKCVASKCTKNCSCKKSKVPCCVACKCEGKEGKCDRTLFSVEESSDDSDSDVVEEM